MKLIKRFRLSKMLNNSYLIEHENKVVLIDAPDDIKKVINFLETEKLKLNQVWLTHIHYDHVLGLGKLKEKYPDLEVYASDEEAKLINDPKSNLLERHAELGSQMLESHVYEHPVLDAENIKASNLKIAYITGHSKKSAIYIFQEEKTMFTGDVLFHRTIGRSDLIYGDQEQLIKGIKTNLLTLEGFTVYSGHGFSTNINDEKKENPYLNE